MKKVRKVMTAGELLQLLENNARRYREGNFFDSIVRNSHMNELTVHDVAELRKNPGLFDRIRDAVLVDFINYIGLSQGGDLGLYVKHLKKKDCPKECVKKEAAKKVFLICPVRKIPKKTAQRTREYVKKLEDEGYQVYWPFRDTDQENDPVGLRICIDNSIGILGADEVHVWWHKKSQGSLFDFGMLFMAMIIGREKKVVIANPEDLEATEGKSFQNVLLSLAKIY